MKNNIVKSISNLKRFKIGDKVRIAAEIFINKITLSGNTERKICLKNLKNEKFGVIVGVRKRFEGYTVHDWEYGGCFKPTRSIWLWEIKTSFTGNPVLSPDDHVFQSNDQEIDFPIHPGMTKESRSRLSEEMKKIYEEEKDSFPRDKKGRFVSLRTGYPQAHHIN